MIIEPGDSRTDQRSIQAIAALHSEGLPELLLSRLGPYFVEAFYRVLRHDGTSLLLVCREGDRPVALAAGGPSVGRNFRRLTWDPGHFFLHLANAILKRPSLLIQLPASLRSEQSLPEGFVELTYITVGAGFRGRGLGQQMVEEYCRWWARRGYAGVELSVEEENVAALGLYEKLGFSVMEKRQEGRYRRFRMRKTF